MKNCRRSPVVERLIGNEEVVSSILTGGSNYAQSMKCPLPTPWINHVELVKKLMPIAELPQGALAVYIQRRYKRGSSS